MKIYTLVLALLTLTNSVFAQGTMFWIDLYNTSAYTPTDPRTGTFNINVGVTAIDGDIYIDNSASFVPSGQSSGFNWSLGDESLVVQITESSVIDVSPLEVTYGHYFKIPRGKTGEFSVTAIVTPEKPGVYRAQLDQVNWTTEPLNVSAYRSEPLWGFNTPGLYLAGTQAVPEPSTVFLGVLGGLALLFRRRIT